VKLFCGFLQFLQSNTGILSQIMPLLFPSTSLAIRYALIALPLDTLYIEVLTAMLNGSEEHKYITCF
jgi:hypothetical protein